MLPFLKESKVKILWTTVIEAVETEKGETVDWGISVRTYRDCSEVW